MKSNTTFIFAGIIAAITTNAMATGENIMTSKSYVDAQDALKQDKLPSKNLTIEIDGEDVNIPSIVLYPADGENAGDVGEVGFISGDAMVDKWEKWEIEHVHDEDYYHAMASELRDWLDTTDAFEYAIPGTALAFAMYAIEQYKADHMVCAGWPDDVPVADRSDANCWLWRRN